MTQMTQTNPLVYLSKIQDIQDLCEFINDPDFSEACDTALKCIADPQIPDGKISGLIVKLQAYSFQFHLKAITYAGIKAGTEDGKHKKNAYYGIYYALDKLVDALKIQARYAR